MTSDSPVKQLHHRISRVAAVRLSMALFGGFISYWVAQTLIGDEIQFSPYFNDGAFLGFLMGLPLGFLRSVATAVMISAVFLIVLGGLYWLYIVALLGI